MHRDRVMLGILALALAVILGLTVGVAVAERLTAAGQELAHTITP